MMAMPEARRSTGRLEIGAAFVQHVAPRGRRRLRRRPEIAQRCLDEDGLGQATVPCTTNGEMTFGARGGSATESREAPSARTAST